jgi:pilus assembly protein FimV
LEDEEPIALSTDELDHILTDKTSEISLEEDEGPIALSEDELGNLLSDVEVTEEGEDLNEILGELPASSDLDAFGSLDEDVSLAQPDSSSPIVPTAETVQDDGMIIVLDEYADEEELSPMEELRKTPDQTVTQPAAAEGVETTPSKEEMKRIMTYLDELLGNLPDDLIREFSQSDYFELYKKLMKQIGV